MRRASGILALAAAGLLAVSGCTPDVPEVQVDPTPTAQPVLTTDQDQAIYDAIGEALSEATTTLDPATLDSRLMGPALALRTAEFTVAKSTGSTDELTEIPTMVQSEIVPTTQTWPRTSFAISARPQNLQTERLFVIEQEAARAQYKLWAWIRLFPGITLPAFSSPEVGTEAVPADDPTLVMTPTDAIAQYVDVLNSGDASTFVASFPTDPFREQMDADKAKLITTAQSIAGTYTVAFAATDGALRALRTADGGALVVGEMTSASTLAGPEGAVVNPTAAQQPFLGGAAATNSVSWGRTAIVGIYVPPADSNLPISVVGSEFLTTSASIP
jgi:hypothetical protein